MQSRMYSKKDRLSAKSGTQKVGNERRGSTAREED